MYLLKDPIKYPEIEITEEALFSTPDEVTDAETLYEGAKYHITVNAYERNPEARQRCIAHYGTSCFVCGFDFGLTYGEVGHGFIHSHHLRELSDIGEQYVIDPINDLRPVCPNCHAIIHKRKPPYSIDEVKVLLQQRNQ
jgi:predicted HNH restriction endonuclease